MLITNCDLYAEKTTGNSINRVIIECKNITDARLLDQLTNKEIRLQTQLTPKIKE